MLRLTAALLLFAATTARADVRIERTARHEIERPGGATERLARREIVWIGDGKVRVDDRVSKESWIVRADLKVIWRIDRALGTWSELTFDEAAAERAAVAMDLRAALARVAGSDDEPRLKHFLDAFAPPDEEVEARDAGGAAKVAGLDTRGVVLATKGGPVAEGRIAEMVPGLENLAKTLGAAGLLTPRQAAAWSKLKGQLISGSWTLVFPEAVVRETFEATKVEETPAPEGTYDVPAGYRKVAAPTLRAGSTAKEAPPGGYEGDKPAGEGEPDEGPTGEEAGKEG